MRRLVAVIHIEVTPCDPDEEFEDPDDILRIIQFSVPRHLDECAMFIGTANTQWCVDDVAIEKFIDYSDEGERLVQYTRGISDG